MGNKSSFECKDPFRKASPKTANDRSKQTNREKLNYSPEIKNNQQSEISRLRAQKYDKRKQEKEKSCVL